jgi:hypothetical protein
MLRVVRLVALLSYWAPALRDLRVVLLRRERSRQVVVMGALVGLLTFVGALALDQLDIASGANIDYDDDGEVTERDHKFHVHLWWAFRQIQDPGNMLGAPEAAGAVVVSMVLTVFGLFLVSFLIGLGDGRGARADDGQPAARAGAARAHGDRARARGDAAAARRAGPLLPKADPRGLAVASLAAPAGRQPAPAGARAAVRGRRPPRRPAAVHPQDDAHRVPPGLGGRPRLHDPRRHRPRPPRAGAGRQRGREPRRRDDPRAADDPRRAAPAPHRPAEATCPQGHAEAPRAAPVRDAVGARPRAPAGRGDPRRAQPAGRVGGDLVRVGRGPDVRRARRAADRAVHGVRGPHRRHRAGARGAAVERGPRDLHVLLRGARRSATRPRRRRRCPRRRPRRCGRCGRGRRRDRPGARWSRSACCTTRARARGCRTACGWPARRRRSRRRGRGSWRWPRASRWSATSRTRCSSRRRRRGGGSADRGRAPGCARAPDLPLRRIVGVRVSAGDGRAARGAGAGRAGGGDPAAGRRRGDAGRGDRALRASTAGWRTTAR